MKSILIIGMGSFGSILAKKFIELKNDVMIIDKNEEQVDKMTPFCTDTLHGDCTHEEVIKSLGLNNFDICFVTIGEDFQSSLEITSLLKENGAKYIVSKANTDIQAKFLLKTGADEVVYPDRQIAERLATRCSASNMFDYIELSPDVSISEIVVPDSWIGKSIINIDVRKKYQLNILAIRRDQHKLDTLPTPEFVFEKGDHIIVMGNTQQIMKFSHKI